MTAGRLYARWPRSGRSNLRKFRRGKIVHRSPDGEGAPQSRVQVVEDRVRPCSYRVKELAEEAPGGGSGGEIEDLLVPIAVRPERLDVGGGNLIRAAGHLLGKEHHRTLAGLERGVEGVGSDRRHRRGIEHFVGQNTAVSQGAVGGIERPRGGERGEFVVSNR